MSRNPSVSSAPHPTRAKNIPPSVPPLQFFQDQSTIYRVILSTPVENTGVAQLVGSDWFEQEPVDRRQIPRAGISIYVMLLYDNNFFYGIDTLTDLLIGGGDGEAFNFFEISGGRRNSVLGPPSPGVYLCYIHNIWNT